MKTTNFVRQLQARASVARPAAAPNAMPAPQSAGVLDHHGQRQGQLSHQHDDQQEFLRARQFNSQQLGLANQGHQVGLSGAAATDVLLGAANAQQAAERKRYARDELDLSFSNTKVVYKSKSMGQLLRNYFVLGLCKNDLLVRNNERLMKWSRRLLGKRLSTLR